jgi:hypothetical protein
MTIRNRLMASVAFSAATDSGTATKAAPAEKAKTVADDMDSRRIFDTIESAVEYLNACATNFSDFSETPLAFPGSDAEGEFDPEVYTDSTQVMVGTLRKAKEGVKCIYIAPVPTLAALLADAAGTDWVQRIIHKELSHVAVRALREAEDISTVVDQMPTTRDAFISSAREGGGGIMEAFNDLYKQISATMGSRVAVWAKFKLTKQELKRAFESKGYAEEFYPALQNRGEGKPSLFVVALELAKLAAGKKGLDATIFQRWLDTRDSKAFNAAEGEDDFDLEGMTESLMSDDAPAAETAEPAKGEEAAA